MKVRQVKKNGKTSWLVDQYHDGQRHRHFFSDKAEAVEFADERERELKAFGSSLGYLSPADRLAVNYHLHRLKEAGATLSQAIDFFLEHRMMAQPCTLEKLTEEFLESRRLAGRRHRYLGKLRNGLNAFLVGRRERKLEAITPREIEAWLTSQGWKPVTMRSYLIDVRTLFAFAVKRGYLTRSPAQAVTMPALDDKTPGILTVDQSRRLLETARAEVPRILPFLALCLLGGIRPAEAVKLTWDEVGRDDGRLVFVPGVKSKTRRTRHVTIHESLKAWLDVSRAEGGELPPKNWRKLFDEVRIRAGLLEGWPHDAMRHSYASYHLAHFQNAALTAHEMGHSQTVLFAHYRALVTRGEAERFFGILPSGWEGKSPGEANNESEAPE